jgi:hypothetical protein
MFRVWEEEKDLTTILSNSSRKQNILLSKVSRASNPLTLLLHLHTILELTFSTDTS